MPLRTPSSSRSAITHRIRVVITKDNMTANLAFSAPEPNQPDVTFEDVREAIERAGVVHGIDWEIVKNAVANKLYDTPIKFAFGTPPRKGQDSKFEYTFEIGQHRAPSVDEKGRLDYRATNFIQSVDEGTVLARKIPPTDGVPGIGVDGKEIPAPKGRNFPFVHGQNTYISDDGNELIAGVTGAVVFCRGKISVNDVATIPGDVDMKTGNINCNGSVKVRGDVQAGFVLNIGGNLEVIGCAQDCTITCKGNILIHGGCFGEGNGKIHADGNVTIKYAEGTHITAGHDVIVGGELLNCHVVAQNSVLLRGQQGIILGGYVCAGKEINCQTAGSSAGTKTTLAVIYDADIPKQYEIITEEIEQLEDNALKVKETLINFYRQPVGKLLPPEQEATIQKLEEFKKSITEELERLNEEKNSLESRIREFENSGIIVRGELHGGVVAQFGEFCHEFIDSRNSCKITLENNQIVISEYK